MNKQTKSLLRSFILLTALAGFWTNVPQAEARRAYSYADMYSPQASEPEVVKPKKKPRPPKRKPISAQVQKPIEKKPEIAEPVPAFEKTEEVVSKPVKPKVESPKTKLEEPKQTITTLLPEKKTSPDLDRAKKITLEELLGSDVVKGMSSR